LPLADTSALLPHPGSMTYDRAFKLFFWFLTHTLIFCYTVNMISFFSLIDFSSTVPSI